MGYNRLILLMAFLLTLTTTAQDKGIKAWLAKRSAKKEAAIAAGEPFLSPLAGPGYTPENGLLLGGGMLFTFKTNKHDSLIQRSSLPLMAFISTKGNFGVNGKLTSFWREDKLRFNVFAKFASANDNYFGVGFEEIEDVEAQDEPTDYHKLYVDIAPEIQFRLVQNLYAGVGVDFNYTKVTDANPYMESDPYYQEFGPENYNSGSKLSLTYDSRDVAVNAWKGIYGYLSSSFYGPYLSGKNQYQIYEMDVRYYQQIHREGNTLAFKIYGRFGYGDIPYEELSRLGGGSALRGYIFGEYRDKTALYLLSEWRHMFQKSSGDLSKHGFALWAGGGSIAPDYKSIEKWVPNYGVGYRFEIQPRMNLRIDFGLGKNTTGLYFNFTEAF